MMDHKTRWLKSISLLVLLLASSAAPVRGETPSVEVKGAVEKSMKWTADSLRKRFSAEIKPVEYTSRGQKHTASCITLFSVLHEAGADSQMKMGPDVAPSAKNHALRLAVVVTSVDGYAACFSLAELLPDMGCTTAGIAFDLDGKPFQEGEGHLRVIVPSDKKPARFVRDIATINIVDISK